MFSIPEIEFSQLFGTKEKESSLYTCLVKKSPDGDGTLITNEEVIESIHNEYFNTETKSDMSLLELCSLPTLSQPKDIIKRSKHLTIQHQNISKKLLLLILKKHLSFKNELNDIFHLRKSIVDTYVSCKHCRNDLVLATEHITSSSLTILHYFRKKLVVKSLLKILYAIKTLCHRKYRLKHCIDEENYQKVIAIISEYHKKTGSNEKYARITALHINLNDVFDQVEENLDTSLSKICSNFDLEKYTAIQDAYNFLGKSQSAINQLHMHFTAAINKAAFDCVNKYSHVNRIKEYQYMCQSVNIENFMVCLLSLCKSLLKILKSYFSIVEWHKNIDNQVLAEEERNQMVLNKNYIFHKLQDGLSKICLDIENKVMIYLDVFNMMSFELEELLQVLSIIDRTCKIEKKVCDRHKSKLHKHTADKFINYFHNYHASRLEELKIFLANESWKLCPVKSSFKITQLREFRSFKYISNSNHITSIHKSLYNKYEGSHFFTDNIWDDDLFFNIISDDFTEEDILQKYENTVVEDLTEDSDDEIPEELKLDYVDEVSSEKILKKKKSEYTGPIITNTSMSLLRTCGRYLQVTCFFHNYNKIIIQGIIEIFEIYFCALYSFFIIDHEICDDNIVINTNVKRTVSRIKDSLFVDYSTITQNLAKDYQVRLPFHSDKYTANDSNSLFGLAERIVSMESLIYLGKQYETFQTYLHSVTSEHEDYAYINLFYSNTISLTVDLRKPIYMVSISRFFDATNILSLMGKVNWELKDVISQHNTYIDILVQKIKKFKEKLGEIQNSISINKEVYESIWENTAYFITHTIVEGFSDAKKCTNGGRALMQLDFTQLVSNFEIITSLRPMPYQDFVTTYIKAYYLPESNVEAWIKNHSEYSSKHVIGLISSMYQNKKVRYKFIAMIEDQRLNRQ